MANPGDERFSINPSDYLGFDYEAYRNDLYALALSKPSEYFDLRKSVIKKVKTEAVGDLYKSFFNILSKGRDKDGRNEIIKPATGPAMIPCYPQQEVSKISLKAARTLDDILNEVIEIILPQDFKDLANDRAIKKSVENI